MKKRLVFLLLAALLLLGAAACSANYGSATKDEDPNYKEITGRESENPDGDENSGSKLEIGLTDPARKLIYYVSYDIETVDFDGSVSGLKALVAELGGYTEASDIQSSSYGGYQSRRTADFVFRIPAAKLNDFFARVGEAGSILSEKLASEDVTLQYIDTQSALNALRAQETRILKLLEDAKDLQYVLDIERELASIRGQIESKTSSLNTLSSLIDYSKVTLRLREVYALTDTKPEPLTFGQRLSDAFGASTKRLWNGLQSFGVWFFGNIIEIVIYLGVPALVIFLIVRAAARKRRRRSEELKKMMGNPPPPPGK